MPDSRFIHLKKLELENVYSYSRSSIEFEKGLVAFAGSNGSGKTSMLEALLLALSLDKRIVRSEIVRRAAGAPAPQGRIRLTLEGDDGARYTVALHIRPGKRRDEIIAAELIEESDKGRRVKAVGVEAVRRELAKILGFQGLPNYGEFLRHSIFAQQGYLREIAEKLGKDFRDVIEAALGLKNVQDAVAKLSKLSLSVDGAGLHSIQIGEAKSLRYSRSYKKIESKLENAIKGVKEARERVKKAEEKLSILNKQKEEVSARLEEAKKAAAVLEERRRELARLEKDIAALESDLRKINDEIRRINSMINELEERRRELENIARLAEAQKLLDEYKDLALEAERLRRIMDEAEQKVRILRDLERYKDSAERYSKIEEELDRVKADYDRVSSELKLLERLEDQILMVTRKLNNIARKWRIKWDPEDPGAILASLEDILEEERKNVETLEDEKNRLLGRESTLKAKLSETRNALEAIRSATRPECPVCGRPLDNASKIALSNRLAQEVALLQEDLEEVRERLVANESRLASAKRKIEALERDIAVANNLVATLESYLSREGIKGLAELRDKVAMLRSELGRLTEEKKKLEREKRKLEAAYKRYLAAQSRADELGISIEDLPVLEDEYKDVSGKLAEIEKRLRKIEDELLQKTGARNMKEAERRVKEAQRAYEELARINEEIVRLKERLESFKQRREEVLSLLKDLEIRRNSTLEDISRYQESVSRIEELEGRLRRINKEIEEALAEKASGERDTEYLEKEVKLLEELRKRFLAGMAAKVILERVQEAAYEEALRRLIDEMNALLSEFNLNVTRVERDGSSFRLVAYRDVNSRAEISTLSGGEKTALALAFIMAFSRVVGGRLSFIVLDEPTAELDEDRRRTLMDLLRRLTADGTINQVIVVAHHNDVLDLADRGCTVRYERERGSVVEC